MGLTSRVCISLDIETTGLNPQSDEVIELGAVRFCGAEVIATYHSLVNPHCALPYQVQLRSGITQPEVDAAPDLSDIVPEMVSFLGDEPIVGHNISFDIDFLSHKGIVLSNPTYDTLELARILLPQLPGYKLPEVAQYLGIPCPVQHRALADAMTAKGVFTALLHRASELGLPILSEIASLTVKSSALGHIFHDIEQGRGDGALSLDEFEAGVLQPSAYDELPLRPSRERALLNLEEMRTIFDDGGPLSIAFPGYERRPEQVRMMQTVAQALNRGRHLIVEAGTGTGKSLAYLLPSLFFALENNTHVVISTNTINLQEQLIGKDTPALLQALGARLPGDRLRVVQVKGRSNYLCLRRWSSLRRGENLSPDELRFLARIQAWLASTKGGDRSELKLGGGEISVWNKVCAQVDDCWGGQCPYQRGGACFLFRARRAAESAHLIIVNHALLLSDIASGAKVLPEYRHLIIDEAHHLEAEATNQLSFRVTQREFLDYLNRIEQRRSGLLARLRERLLLSDIIPLRRSHLEQLSADLRRRANRAKEWVSQLFAVLLRFLEAHTEEQGEYERHLRLTEAVRRQREWSDVQLAWDNLSSELRGISDMLNELYIALEDLSGERFPDCEGLMLEISSLLHSGEQLQHRVSSIVSRPEANDIYWLSLGGGNGSLSLCAAPLRVDDFLKERLFSEKECVVLTGATLSTGGDFEYIKGCLGLDDADELLLGAPFDYSSSALVCIPSDIPEPGETGYQQAVDEALIELCSAVGGRALVLFTSHSALRSTLAAIRTPLEMKGILVLGHGVDGSPTKLLETFKAEPKSVLLGTASFWEGVDVVGEALSIVVITRLPFSVPTEPIFAARSETFANPFDGYALPQAALRFKQGFGRLIRSKSDHGVMVILDSRIKNRYYGAVFLKSLPPCTVVSGTRADLPATVLGWLEGSRGDYAGDL